ncbi:MAG TPA: serine/threonine-protein kinase [Pyrinomonadaceae bacterium]|jgi:serine/threonine protein kinase|nr:serine/threonine-protein kinase [Pyrinomonadaceae bacterium]
MVETGTILQGRFLIEQELARGGMGAVYLAIDQKFGSRVAIKKRFYANAELAEAFEREGRLLNGLHHPILPHVSDYFREGDGHFIVMEYIEGDDLSQMLKRGETFPVENVVRWMRELLDGLDYLHSQNPPIIHRDIKPGNLKITSRGNIVLLDFGLAKETSGDTLGVKSVFGYSRRYSPLEQIEGAGTDARSDIFSLGATIYHLLVGEPPIDVLARASAIVSGRPDPLTLASDINKNVPVALARSLDRALALNADLRFASAKQMQTAVGQALEHLSPPQAELMSSPTVVATAPRNFLEPENLPLLGESVKRANHDSSEIPKSLAPGAPVVSGVSKKASPLYGKRYRLPLVRPFWRRPAFWMAAILVALLASGYASLRSFIETSAPAPSSAVENQTASLSDTDEPSDQTRSDNQPSDSDSPPARPALPKSKDRPKMADRSITREPAARQDGSPLQRMTPVSVHRQEHSIGQRALPTRRSVGQIPRLNSSNDRPPASSIEVILTGLPPKQRPRRVPY